jgi:hypothetical protein
MSFLQILSLAAAVGIVDALPKAQLGLPGIGVGAATSAGVGGELININMKKTS